MIRAVNRLANRENNTQHSRFQKNGLRTLDAQYLSIYVFFLFFYCDFFLEFTSFEWETRAMRSRRSSWNTKTLLNRWCKQTNEGTQVARVSPLCEWLAVLLRDRRSRVCVCVCAVAWSQVRLHSLHSERGESVRPFNAHTPVDGEQRSIHSLAIYSDRSLHFSALLIAAFG